MSSEQELNKTSAVHKEFQNLLDKDFKDRKLVANQVIKAKVIDILKAHVVVDVRGKSEGMIPLSEFKAEELSKLKVNDTIKVYLERLEGKEGEIVLSYSKAKSFAAWQKCIDAFEKELAKYTKQNIYGDKIVIGMGAGTISNWMRNLPKLVK